MDEVLFHLSQRLESLQVVGYSALQHGRVLWDSYTAQGYELIIRLYNSPQLAQLQESAYYKLQQLLTILKEYSIFVLSYAHPTVVYARISTIIVPDMLRNGRALLDSYTAQGSELIIQLYNSPQLAHLQETAYFKLQQLLNMLKEYNTFVLSYAHLTVIYKRISAIIIPDINRGSLYAGFIGFAIGGGIGVVIGFCLQPPAKPLSYMRGIAATSFTGIDTVAVLEDISTPTVCGPDDVLIQVRAASIDPIDIKICHGYARVLRYQMNKYNPNVKGELPVVLGRDCAGIVVEVGSSVTKFEIGDEVWAVVPPWAPGLLSDFVVVKDKWASHKPRCLGFEGSASIPYSGSVAWDAVINRAHLGPVTARGKKVLVHCGSSGVGVLITQLCRTWDAVVTVTCLNRASPVMNALGANLVVPLETADIEKQLSKERFDVVFNCAGPVALQFCLNLCSPEGVVVTPICSSLASDAYGILFGTLYSAWVRITHSLFGCTTWGTVPLNASVLDQLSKLVDSGLLQPVVDKILAPHDFDRAFQHIDSAHAIGKTVIQFSSSGTLLPHGQPDVIA